MNPIVRREWLGVLRTRSALFAQLLLGTVSAGLVLARWPVAGIGDVDGSAALQVLRVFGYGSLACLVLVVPAFAATGIVRERVKGTLALLLNSPMSVRSIYAGKLAGTFGFTLWLLAVTLPAGAACYALGGSLIQGGVGLLYLVLVMTTLLATTLGLFISSRATSLDSALRTTYGAMLAVCLVPLAFHWLIPPDSALLKALSNWVGCLSPIPAMMEAVGQGGAGIAGVDYAPGAVFRFPLVAGLMSFGLAIMTIRNLRQSPLDRARPPGIMTQDRSQNEQTARRVLFLIDPGKRKAGIPDYVNPVMAKEFLTRRFGRSHWTLRIVALCAVLSLGLSYLAAAGALGWGVEVIGGALVLLQASLLLLFVPSLSAGLISSEREQESWTLLRMTPLKPATILRGKLASAVWPVILLFGATIPGYLVMVTVKPELTAQIPRVVISLGLMALFAVAVGAAASACFRTTSTATAAAYLALAVVCVAPFFVWLGRDAPFGESTVTAALSVNPVAAALNAAGMPGFTVYELIPFTWWFVGAATVALFAIVFVRIGQLCRPQ
jgi:ABC-type transport system involved in multi-copper enzyme maturation permease subunit